MKGEKSQEKVTEGWGERKMDLEKKWKRGEVKEKSNFRNGSGKLRLTTTYVTETLTFSSTGFHRWQLPITDLRRPLRRHGR
jgi:hypothetical protein